MTNRLVPPYPPLENRPSLSAFELILRLRSSVNTPKQETPSTEIKVPGKGG